MVLTRVSTSALKSTVAAADTEIAALRGLLESVLVSSLSTEDRARVLRAPNDLADPAREVLAQAPRFPSLLAAVKYDPPAVREDLENLEVLAGLAQRLGELQRWVEDSRLAWEGELYQQTLALYNVAKPLVASDPSLQALVDPMEKLFASRRKPAKASDPG
jgi:hypothetical protein